MLLGKEENALFPHVFRLATSSWSKSFPDDLFKQPSLLYSIITSKPGTQSWVCMTFETNEGKWQMNAMLFIYFLIDVDFLNACLWTIWFSTSQSNRATGGSQTNHNSRYKNQIQVQIWGKCQHPLNAIITTDCRFQRCWKFCLRLIIELPVVIKILNVAQNNN